MGQTSLNIVITGASRGIGYETALRLCAMGHHVLAVSRSLSGLKQLEERLRVDDYRAKLTLLPFDITDGEELQQLLPRIQESAGEVDVLINNAGMLINKPFAEISPAELEEVYRANVFAPFRLIQLLLPLLEASPSAHIVNIGSMGGYQGSAKFPGLSAYSSSKAALSNLSELLAAELGEKRVAVNCLALGAAQTDMLAAAFPGYKAPLTAAEMGEFIGWFAVNGQKFFNGKVLPVALGTP